MSGAYTAKPAATVEDERPPGWDINWPWPGPFPPGFDWRDYEWPGLAEDGGGKPSDDDPTGKNPDPTPRILVYPTSGRETREGDDGSVDRSSLKNFFFVVLTAAPKNGAITVPIIPSDTSEVLPRYYYGAGSSLEFQNTEGDWDRPRKVELCGISDNIEDGDISYTIQVGPSDSFHVDYCGLYGSDVSGVNIETVWELKVRVVYQASGSVGIAGTSHATGKFSVSGPEGGGGGGGRSRRVGI